MRGTLAVLVDTAAVVHLAGGATCVMSGKAAGMGRCGRERVKLVPR